METLEQIHQLTLFKLLDADVPDWINYITIDSNGFITVYKDIPQTSISVDGSGVWATDANLSESSWKYMYDTGDNIIRIASLPNKTIWTECIWKLR